LLVWTPTKIAVLLHAGLLLLLAGGGSPSHGILHGQALEAAAAVKLACEWL
jgi:hypothetical protein